MLSRRSALTGLAALAVKFALSNAPASAQTRFNTLAEEYVKEKLQQKKINLETSAVMRFVNNLFIFEIRDPAQFKNTWEKAADAAIDLAAYNRATFDRINCLALNVVSISPFRVMSPAYNFKAKIAEIAAPNSRWLRERANAMERAGNTTCGTSL